MADSLEQFCSRGRAQKKGHYAVLYALADFFEDLERNPTAWYQPKRGSRNSPFIRFARAFTSALPKPQRVWMDSGLEECAARALKERKVCGLRTNLAELPSWETLIPETAYEIEFKGLSGA